MVQLRNRETGVEHTAVVVDAEQIESDFYMADGRAITDLMGQFEACSCNQDVERGVLVELAHRYVDSIQLVDDYEKMTTLDANPDEPIQEGIIEGGIQTGAILGNLRFE